MTDDQFERIKKGLNFHSEGGVYNLCTLTETALREIIEDAEKFYEKQQKIDAEQIRALQKQNGKLTDKVKELEKELIRAETFFKVVQENDFMNCRCSHKSGSSECDRSDCDICNCTYDFFETNIDKILHERTDYIFKE